MTNKLLKFINRNKFNVLWFFTFTVLLFIFVPKQEEYYWKTDVKNFKDNFYLKFSLIISVLLTFIVLIINLIKRKNYQSIIISILGSILFCCWFFFFFQSIIISIILLINRKFENRLIEKQYKVLFITENKFLSAYEINNRKIIIHEDEYLKHPQHKKLDQIKANEILRLDFYEGIFGINSIKK